MNNKKLLLFGGIALAIILVVAIVVRKNSDKGMKVIVAESAKSDITETVIANGKIQPAQDVQISSDVSGEITELLVKEGEKVVAGQLLVRINPDLYLAGLNRADAALNSSQANLANAKASLAQVKAQYVNNQGIYARNKELFAKKAISQADYDNALATYEASKAQVDAAEQQVKASEYSVRSASATKKEAQDQLNRTTIYAPTDGIISALDVEQGERVLGTSQMSGTVMMRISGMTELEVHVDVNENDIVRVKMGDTAIVKVDSYLDKEFKGIVTEIANAPKNANQAISTDQVINFAVKVSIIKESYADLVKGKSVNFSPFKPGMSASVEIQTNTVRNVLSVPLESVTTRNDTSGTRKAKNKKVDDKNVTEDFECVFVYENGKALITPVKTGIQDNKNIQILSGLKEGQQVITGPYSAVSRKLDHNDAVIKSEADEIYEDEESDK